MAQSVKGNIEQVLKEFCQTSDIDTCAVVSDEGFTLGAVNPPGTDPELYTAVSVSLGGGGIQACRRARLGKVKSLMLTGEEGTILLKPLTTGMLIAKLGKSARPGVALIELSKFAEEVDDILIALSTRGAIDVKEARERIREVEDSEFFRKIKDQVGGMIKEEIKR